MFLPSIKILFAASTVLSKPSNVVRPGGLGASLHKKTTSVKYKSVAFTPVNILSTAPSIVIAKLWKLFDNVKCPVQLTQHHVTVFACNLNTPPC